MSVNRKIKRLSLLAIGMLTVLGSVSACHASTILSEILYDAAGTDVGMTFVELAGRPGTVLDGLALEGINGRDGAVYRRIDLAGVMPEDGIFLVADDRGDGTSFIADADQVAWVDFQNGPDSIVLRSGGGVPDALGYGDFLQGIFAGEGRAAPDAMAGHSLARRNPWLDSNDNLADFKVLATPTPGGANAVPLPSALLLMLSGFSGLLGIGALRRR